MTSFSSSRCSVGTGVKNSVRAVQYPQYTPHPPTERVRSHQPTCLFLEVWPEEFEQALIMDSNATVLPAELDMDLKVGTSF